MRLTQGLVGMFLVSVVMGATVADADAQVLGTFRWRVAPYCNVITLTAVQQGPAILVSGFDDNCGLVDGDPVTGGVFLNGSEGTGNLSLIDRFGRPSTIRFTIGLANLSGTWVDDGGRTGDFTFNPAAAPGGRRPVAHDLWAYVVASGTGFHASSGGLSVTHPATGEYCILLDERRSYKAAQVTLADPGGHVIVSVGTGHGSACNPLNDDEHNVVPVFTTLPSGTPINANFTILIPAR